MKIIGNYGKPFIFIRIIIKIGEMRFGPVAIENRLRNADSIDGTQSYHLYRPYVNSKLELFDLFLLIQNCSFMLSFCTIYT